MTVQDQKKWLDPRERQLVEKCTAALEHGAENAQDVYLYAIQDERFSPEEILKMALEIFPVD